MTIKNNSDIRNILLIKLRGIGDVILSTIVIRNLKLQFPNARIDFLTEMPSFSVLSSLPEINNIYVLKNKSLKSLLQLIFRLKKIKYDIVFDLFSNPRTALITKLVNSKYRIGYKKRGREYAYNLTTDIDKMNIHNAECNLEQLKLLNIPIVSNVLLYEINKSELDFASNYFHKNDLNKFSVIGILPGGGWESKRCPPEIFIKLMYKIQNNTKYKFLILYGNTDKKDALSIYNNSKDISILGPETNIREMVALLKQCEAVIANDSGPMHLATAINIPTIAIHGPTSPHKQGPFGKNHRWIRNDTLHCIECNLLNCPYNQECMYSLDIDKTVMLFQEMVKK